MERKKNEGRGRGKDRRKGDMRKGGEERSKERGEREGRRKGEKMEEEGRKLVTHHACQHAPKTPHVERVIILLVVHEQLWSLKVS